MKKLLFYVLSVFLLLSCQDNAPEPKDNTIIIETGNTYFEPRISIEGIAGGLLQFTVQIEGSEGQSITGANVIVRDLLNRTQVLRFSSANYSYTGTMQDIKDVNLYTVSIDSALLKNRMIVNVPYLQFQNKPAITILRDENGASALSGLSLNGSRDIQAAWASSGVNTAYQIIVRTALTVVYSVITEDLTITIPKNTIDAGSYLISIKAQKICGDPLFRDYNYYSVSTENSMDIAFNVY